MLFLMPIFPIGLKALRTKVAIFNSKFPGLIRRYPKNDTMDLPGNIEIVLSIKKYVDSIYLGLWKMFIIIRTPEVKLPFLSN